MTALSRARSRLRRCLHFVPGGSEKMRAKAASLPADSLVLDLEDAVAPDATAKRDARAAVAQWLRSCEIGERERVVRINPLDSEWGADDIEAIVPARPDALMIPKAESLAGMRELDERIASAERAAGMDVGAIALIVIATETPRALFHSEEIAGAPRVAALTWGAEDLSAALGARATRDAGGAYLGVFAHARAMTLLAARAAGVQAIDGVFTDLGSGDFLF